MFIAPIQTVNTPHTLCSGQPTYPLRGCAFIDGQEDSRSSSRFLGILTDTLGHVIATLRLQRNYLREKKQKLREDLIVAINKDKVLQKQQTIR